MDAMKHAANYERPLTFNAAHREFEARFRLGAEHRLGHHCATCHYVGRHRV